MHFFWTWALRLAYWPLNWRVLWSRLVSFAMGERQRAPLTEYGSVEAVEKVLAGCLYDKDPLQGVLDYVSPARYIQFLIDSLPKPIIGDCDDFHWYAANVLRDVPGVEDVLFLSCGFKGGAHSTVVFQKFGEWFHFDYRVHSLKNPNDAPNMVARRYTTEKQTGEATWWVWESVEPWRPVAIYPDTLPILEFDSE